MRIPNYIKNFANLGISYPKLKYKTQVSQSLDDDYIPDGYNVSKYEKKDVPYYSMEIKKRLERIEEFASIHDIEWVLIQMVGEILSYEGKYFMKLDTTTLEQKYGKDDKGKEIINYAKKKFEKFYSLHNFQDEVKVFELYVKLLTYGALAWEIIYDDIDDPKDIVAFKEIDVTTIKQVTEYVEMINSDGDIVKIPKKLWIQNIDGKDVVLSDEQVIYVKFKGIPGVKSVNGSISYVERLMKPYNMFSNIETAVNAWTIQNSVYRTKIVVPVGNKSTPRIKQIVSRTLAKYGEDLYIDNRDGSVYVKGYKEMNYGKTIVMPKRDGQTVDIDNIKYQGPDLSKTDIVEYFGKRFWKSTMLPQSRMDRSQNGGRLIFYNYDGIDNDEYVTTKFCDFIRSEFEKTISKPLILALKMKYDTLKLTNDIESAISFEHYSKNYVEQAKKQQIEKKKWEDVSNLERISGDDGREPLFSKKFLIVDKFKLMTEDEWEMNEKRKKEAKGDDGNRRR